MMQLLKNIKPYRFFVVLVLLLTFLQSLFQLYLLTLMADLVDTGIVQGDMAYILRIGEIMLGGTAGMWFVP